MTHVVVISNKEYTKRHTFYIFQMNGGKFIKKHTFILILTSAMSLND